MIKIFLITMLSFHFTSCASVSKREKDILDYPQEKIATYENMLVDLRQYTTNGLEYHAMYRKHLIGIARYIIEERKMSVAKGSIGFYFDKRENKRNKLYLGVDIDISLNQDQMRMSYKETAMSIITRHLADIMFIIYSCKTVFDEREIIGAVIGFHWRKGDDSDMANVWIDKGDIMKFENKELTLSEVIHRNSITDTKGKVMKIQP
jgi:hypothetical protein